MTLLELGLTALGRRWPLLSSAAVRLRLVAVTAAAYLAVLAILTWQALRGQSIVHPDVATVGATCGVAVLTGAAWALVLTTGALRRSQVGVGGLDRALLDAS